MKKISAVATVIVAFLFTACGEYIEIEMPSVSTQQDVYYQTEVFVESNDDNTIIKDAIINRGHCKVLRNYRLYKDDLLKVMEDEGDEFGEYVTEKRGMSGKIEPLNKLVKFAIKKGDTYFTAKEYTYDYRVYNQIIDKLEADARRKVWNEAGFQTYRDGRPIYADRYDWYKQEERLYPWKDPERAAMNKRYEETKPKADAAAGNARRNFPKSEEYKQSLEQFIQKSREDFKVSLAKIGSWSLKNPEDPKNPEYNFYKENPEYKDIIKESTFGVGKIKFGNRIKFLVARCGQKIKEITLVTNGGDFTYEFY